MKINVLFLMVCLCAGCSKAQDAEHARNADWRITPPPTEEEMSHYRIVRNEANTAYAVQSSNTCWLDEHSWWQHGNTWNTLGECTNDIHSDVEAWRKRQHPEKWNPISAEPLETPKGIPVNSGYGTNLPIRWQYQEVREQQNLYERQKKAAEAFNKTNTNQHVGMMVTIPNMHFEHRLTTNDIELGYRSDGSVIWRTPPEAY